VNAAAANAAVANAAVANAAVASVPIGGRSKAEVPATNALTPL
jgi:hypothetical protein